VPRRACDSGAVHRTLTNMKPERLELLMTTYDACVRRHAIFREVFGLI